jgi:hypothetical protein
MGRSGRNFYCVPTQAEGNDIGKVVRGVGEQGKAVAENPRDDFNEDKGGCQSQGNGETFCRLFGRVAKMGMRVGI